MKRFLTSKGFLSSRQIARKAGISYQTLFNWLEAGLLSKPQVQVGGTTYREWTEADLPRLIRLRKRKKDPGGRPRKSLDTRRPQKGSRTASTMARQKEKQ